MRAPRTSLLDQRRLMLIVTLIVAVFVLFFPARQLVQQREQIVSLEERMAALKAENERLDMEVARLTDPSEVEVLARERLGLVRPGERAYFVEPTGTPQTEISEEVSSPEPPWWSRAWKWLRSLVRGRG